MAMSTPRGRMRSHGEAIGDVNSKVSGGRKPVIGLRPIKEKSKRSEAMIDEQLLFMRETQNYLRETLDNLEKALAEDGFEKTEEDLQKLFDKSDEILVIVQVLMKIRNELAYARLDLERAVKSNFGVDAAKKRVKWLQDRLEKVLLTAKSYCHLHNRSLQRSKTPQSRLKDQISEKLWNKLSEGQQKMLLESEERKQHIHCIIDNGPATPIVKEITKMQLPQTDSAESVSVETGSRDAEAKEEAIHMVTVTDHDLTQQSNKPGPFAGKRKQRKRLDGSKGSGDATVMKSESSTVVDLLPPTSPGGHHSDQESVTTFEPLSEPEEFDDHHSESILSSVGVQELDEAGYDYGSSSTEVTSPSEVINDGSHKDKVDAKSVIISAMDKVEEKDDLNSDGEYPNGDDDDDDDDKVADYWDSDHHKFEWSGYMQSLDPRSWHALGLGVPESFLSKEKPKFDPELPWKEKPMKVNSVIDVHKIALDRLLLRLHKMYEAVGQATQSTIDPAIKDEKIETVIGKLELEVEGSGSAMEKQQSTQPLITKQASHISLPQISSPVARQKSMMSLEKYPVVIHEPTVIRTARPNRTKLYPQESSAWCDDVESGYTMPRIVKVQARPKLHKSKSLIQSRYKQQKQDSPRNERQVSELDLANKSLWKPTMVRKIVTALKGFNKEGEQSELERDRDGPKWKRIQTLLGEGGLMSSNPVIAAEAAKTIGKLKCREQCVVDTLSQVIKLQRDAKVCYEASKAVILLGTWDPYAMSVIRQYIKQGNKDIVLELLSTMTKARDIAFVDKTTNEFKKLVNLLIFTIKTQSPELAFHAAVSLGRLCVVEPVSKAYLISRLSGLSPHDKGEALYVLIKQMNCKEKRVVEALMEQLNTAYNWKLRMEAADLLIFIGGRDVFTVKSADEVFDILERLLWDHANKELRAKVSDALSSLNLRQRATEVVLRRLEDPAEEVRARAVISLATLGMKGVKEMKALLDLLELDSSVYVRIQVVRAFGNMEWNDPRILRSLRERERGEGSLATEARKTLAFLARCPTTK